MSNNQGYSMPLNNVNITTTSPYYYNSKPMQNNHNYYNPVSFNSFDTSTNQSINTSGYASTDSMLFGGSMYTSPSLNNSLYSGMNTSNHSPYPFSPSMYNNAGNYSTYYQQQAATTSSPNYIMPLQESTSANNNYDGKKKTGVKRSRAILDNQELQNVEPSFDTNYILNEIFKKTDDNSIEQPQAKKSKRAYNKKPKQVQNDVASSKLQEPNDYQLNNNSVSYLNYNDVQQLNSRVQLQQNGDFDENDYDDDEDEENYSVNSFGERKKRVLTRTQRIAANQRERKRMNIMNQSYMKLRQVLPISTGRKRRKMSRLDIVVGAMEYISYLAELVERDEPCEIKFDIFKNCLYDYD